MSEQPSSDGNTAPDPRMEWAQTVGTLASSQIRLTCLRGQSRQWWPKRGALGSLASASPRRCGWSTSGTSSRLRPASVLLSGIQS